MMTFLTYMGLLMFMSIPGGTDLLGLTEEAVSDSLDTADVESIEEFPGDTAAAVSWTSRTIH